MSDFITTVFTALATFLLVMLAFGLAARIYPII
jgi:hypothetical protein